MTSPERQYLLDILIAAEEIQSFVAGHDEDVLTTDRLIRGAVLFSFAKIGEASSRLLKLGSVDGLPDLPWRKMSDLRNVIVHEYDGVHLDRVWEIIQRELPTVVRTLVPLFPERPGS